MIKMGQKIRELRKEKGISQDILAQALGVSFQAVSKWENELSMPDMSMIPAIASYFDVSIDDLFDYNRLVAERRVTEICDAAADYRFSDPAKSEAMLREGLKQYPGNDIILNNLLCVLKPEDRAEEIISICKMLIEYTHEDEVKYDALRILADTYHHTGQQALVAPTLEQIPEIYFTKLEEMAIMLEGDASLDAARRQAMIDFEILELMLSIIRERYREKGEQEKVEKYDRLARGLLELFAEAVPETERTSLLQWVDEILARLV